MEDTAAPDAYQVDFIVEDGGKRKPESKKRITWQFVTSQQQDETRSVTLNWSKRSGKQSIDMDGSEVWFGRNSGATVFNHQWTTRDGIDLHILASKTTPTKVPEDFVKYELMINGRKFSSLPARDGGTPPVPGGSSIVEILYPKGYDRDAFKTSSGAAAAAATEPVLTPVGYQLNSEPQQKVAGIVRHEDAIPL